MTRVSLGLVALMVSAALAVAQGSSVDYIVEADAPGFTVEVDGAAVAQAPAGQMRVAVRLQIGRSYSIRVSKPGYEPDTRTITADELGNRVTLRLRSSSSAAPPAAAGPGQNTIDYIIDTNVPGALIEVDGVATARTSETEARAAVPLVVGRSYRLRISRDGFVPEEREVVAEELGNRLSVTLRPSRDERGETAAGPGGLFGTAVVVGAVGLAVLIVASAVYMRQRGPAKERTAPVSVAALQGPVSFDRYQLVGTLGVGGIATIYKGIDARDGSEVAVKILDAKWLLDPDMVHKFMAEADALHAIHEADPSAPVVQLLASGREGNRIGGRPFLALELLRGDTLYARLARSGALPELEAVAAGLQIARALDVVHRVGIVHRDLTPDNIFLVPGDVRVGARLYKGVPRVVLIDFGVARQEALTWVTTDGSIVGKPPYMSPEQCRGAKVDYRSDLYALGLVLYAMVAGAPPFVGRNSLDVMAAQQKAPVPPLDGRVSPDVAATIYALLAKNPEERLGPAAVASTHLEAHFVTLAAGMGGNRTMA